MAKLNQIIAIEKGVKARAYADISTLNKVAQKAELFSGFVKTYEKKDEDSEDLPGERKKVQYRAEDVLGLVQKALTELFDVTAQKDWTNCAATASVVVDGTTILAFVPVTYLLFLEKQLTDLRTLVGNLPVLDSDEDWSEDAGSGLYKTPPTKTHRTKKVAKPIVLYPATPEHPAQTQLVTEDVLAGYWVTVKQSGALTARRKEEVAARVEKLLQAVKAAREEANGADDTDTPSVGRAVFEYLFA